MSTTSIIKVKFKNKIIYTLYDDDKCELFCRNKTPFVCYDIVSLKNDLKTEISQEVFYDFDNNTINNPIDYKDVLNKWNFLDDISICFKMYFEGNCEKRTYTYEHLFKRRTSIFKLDKRIYLPKKCVKDIKKVLAKQKRLLNKLFKFAI